MRFRPWADTSVPPHSAHVATCHPSPPPYPPATKCPNVPQVGLLGHLREPESGFGREALFSGMCCVWHAIKRRGLGRFNFPIEFAIMDTAALKPTLH